MSVYVTDTHSLIFYVTGMNKKLSRRALRAFEQAMRCEAFVYIPAVVLWEISRLERTGLISLNEPFDSWSAALLAHPCFECVPLDETIVLEARNYAFNRDIFDAAIAATAKLKDVPLITRDDAITQSGVVDVWW